MRPKRPQLGAGIMFADDIRRALQGTPRGRLADLSAAVWKGYACGALAEGEAQQYGPICKSLTGRSLNVRDSGALGRHRD